MLVANVQEMSEDARHQHPAYLPGNFSALRATGVDLLHENGAFLLSLTELRLVTGHDNISRPTNVEIGRFYLSPVAVLLLAQQTIQAMAAFKGATGIPREIKKIFGTERVQEVITSLEKALKPETDRPKELP
jgi:hypothetical protein